MFVHPIILYGNDLICIVIIINKNFKKLGKNRGKVITLLCVGGGGLMNSTMHPLDNTSMIPKSFSGAI